jgi:hypothetical protein
VEVDSGSLVMFELYCDVLIWSCSSFRLYSLFTQLSVISVWSLWILVKLCFEDLGF